MTPPTCSRCNTPMRPYGNAPSGGKVWKCQPCRKYRTVHSEGHQPKAARVPYYRESALPAPLPAAPAPKHAGRPQVTFLPPAAAYGADVPADCWRIARATVRSGSAE